MYKEITSFEKALELCKDKITLPDLSGLPDKYSKGMMALLKLQIIADVVNNDDDSVPDFEPDYNNAKQVKWFPWYRGDDSSGAGFRFSVSNYGWAFTPAVGGARLALKDEERANHMNKYFQDLYRDLYLIIK